MEAGSAGCKLWAILSLAEIKPLVSHRTLPWQARRLRVRAVRNYVPVTCESCPTLLLRAHAPTWHSLYSSLRDTCPFWHEKRPSVYGLPSKPEESKKARAESHGKGGRFQTGSPRQNPPLGGTLPWPLWGRLPLAGRWHRQRYHRFHMWLRAAYDVVCLLNWEGLKECRGEPAGHGEEGLPLLSRKVDSQVS